MVGYAQLAQGKLDEAEASFKRALKISPSNPTARAGFSQLRMANAALVNDGWGEYYKGKYLEALSEFESKAKILKSKGSPAAEEGRGWTLIALGRPKDAMQAFRAALSIDANSNNAKSGMIAAERASLGVYTRAWSRMTSGDYEGAIGSFDFARTKVVPSALWLIEDGLAWIDYYKGDTANAEKKFKAVLNAKPNAYLSNKGLGLIALLNNDYDKATQYLSASFSANPFQLLASYTSPAQALLDANEYAHAVKILRLGENAYPYSADIKFQLAKAYKGMKDMASANEKAIFAAQLAPTYISPVFETLEMSGGKLKDAYLAMAAGLFAAGFSEAALFRYNQYFEAGGDQLGALIGVGWSQLNLGQEAEAEETFKKLKNSGDPNLKPLGNMGLAFIDIERGNIETGFPQLMTLLKANPYQLLSIYTLASFKLIEANNHTMASEILKIGETIYPLSADIQALLAKAMKAQGDDKGAAMRLVAAARLAPTYMNAGFDDLGIDSKLLADAYYAMAWGDYFAGNNEGAIYRFNEYLEAGGQDPNALRGRGFALYRIGNYEEAKADLASVVAKEPDPLLPVTEVVPLPGVGQSWTIVYTARSTLAWLEYWSGNPENAVAEFSKVLKLYPSLVDGNTGLGYALLAQGKKTEAESAFRAALKVSPYYPDALRGMEELSSL